MQAVGGGLEGRFREAHSTSEPNNGICDYQAGTGVNRLLPASSIQDQASRIKHPAAFDMRPAWEVYCILLWRLCWVPGAFGYVQAPRILTARGPQRPGARPGRPGEKAWARCCVGPAQEASGFTAEGRWCLTT